MNLHYFRISSEENGGAVKDVSYEKTIEILKSRDWKVNQYFALDRNEAEALFVEKNPVLQNFSITLSTNNSNYRTLKLPIENIDTLADLLRLYFDDDELFEDQKSWESIQDANPQSGPPITLIAIATIMIVTAAVIIFYDVYK